MNPVKQRAALKIKCRALVQPSAMCFHSVKLPFLFSVLTLIRSCKLTFEKVLSCGHCATCRAASGCLLAMLEDEIFSIRLPSTLSAGRILEATPQNRALGKVRSRSFILPGARIR